MSRSTDRPDGAPATVEPGWKSMFGENGSFSHPSTGGDGLSRGLPIAVCLVGVGVLEAGL
jgi:hypothetical protein